jgi:putative toxin-antitoxin system antitoxin component (TIGR02293 family)
MQVLNAKKREKKVGPKAEPPIRNLASQTKFSDVEKDKKNTEEDVFRTIFHRKPLSQMDTIEMSIEGVTKRSLNSFMHYFKFSPDQIAHMLPVTLRTIQRYNINQKFNATISEHIIQLVALMAKGVEVFGDREKFMRWFNSPSKPLGGKAPTDLVCLKTGTQIVMDELGRIEYGIFA